MIIENYRRWFEYEGDVHRLALESLERLDASHKTLPEFQKAVDLLAHVIAARKVWLFRFGETPENAELFPRNTQLETIAQSLNEMEAKWNPFLEKLSDVDLQRVFEYTSYEGSRFRNSVGDILTQLFGHSWYHRGQIASLVRSMGGEPAVTDFVFWAREAVAE